MNWGHVFTSPDQEKTLDLLLAASDSLRRPEKSPDLPTKLPKLATVSMSRGLWHVRDRQTSLFCFDSLRSHFFRATAVNTIYIQSALFSQVSARGGKFIT